MEEQVGGKFADWDQIALKREFNSIQLALLAHKAKSPGLLSQCMVRDLRAGAGPQSAAKPAATAVSSSPARTADAAAMRSATSSRYQLPTQECEAAIEDAFERAVGGDWCSVRKKDVPRIVGEMEKVNQGPLCKGRSGSAQAHRVEYFAPIRCEVQREGSPDEEEARLVERILLGGKCLPTSDPAVEKAVQFYARGGMSRSEARKNLSRVVPIIPGEDPSLRFSKTCAGNYLLTTWAPK
jgi:hypothetical protein